MKRHNVLILHFASMLHGAASAQFSVTQPTIPTPTYTIYLAPNGNDANPGTISQPKKTFHNAINAIPFGQPGVNGGNAYGEVVLLSGHYYPKGNQNFEQSNSQWRTYVGGVPVYKNISIRGIGDVVIHGDSLNTMQTIYLVGNGVRVRNIKIKNAPGHAIFIKGDYHNYHKNALVDSVEVDGAKQFGINIEAFDYVLVKNAVVRNTCLAHQNEPPANNCSWASGLRAMYANHVTIQNCTIYNNWGEGLVTSNGEFVVVKDNVVYDNYSANIYCHSISKGIYSHNLIYNTDSTYWRYCVGGNGRAASGISCANEFSCEQGCLLWTNSCGSKVTCCALANDGQNYQPVQFKQLDSIYIFNNVILDAEIDIWDAFSNFIHYANISNFFIHHNTIIGIAGASGLNKAPIMLGLNNFFVWFSNLNIFSNIISFDTSLINNKPFIVHVPNNTCNGNWQSEIKLNQNRWRVMPNTAGVNISADNANSQLPPYTPFNDLSNITPNSQNAHLVQFGSLPPYVTDDFFHLSRMSNTNIGAIEFQNTTSQPMQNGFDDELVSIYAANGHLYFHSSLHVMSAIATDLNGRVLSSSEQEPVNAMNINHLPQGLYLVYFTTEDGRTFVRKFAAVR
ncbi:MAG: right-handed parallel beta-helix repeat-containing protein [Chitinophagales bacterium]|nr:right-handed parallel beta-helix repeat-containing protein [Chitinophagales bacterium]